MYDVRMLYMDVGSGQISCAAGTVVPSIGLISIDFDTIYVFVPDCLSVCESTPRTQCNLHSNRNVQFDTIQYSIWHIVFACVGMHPLN